MDSIWRGPITDHLLLIGGDGGIATGDQGLGSERAAILAISSLGD